MVLLSTDNRKFFSLVLFVQWPLRECMSDHQCQKMTANASIGMGLSLGGDSLDVVPALQIEMARVDGREPHPPSPIYTPRGQSRNI